MITCLDRERRNGDFAEDERDMRTMQDKVRDLEWRLLKAEMGGGTDASPGGQSAGSTGDVRQLHDKLERLESSIVKTVDVVHARSQMALDQVSALQRPPPSMAPVGAIQDATAEERLVNKIRQLLESESFLGGMRYAIQEEMRRHERDSLEKMQKIDNEIGITRQEFSLRMQFFEKELQTMTQLMAAPRPAFDAGQPSTADRDPYMPYGTPMSPGGKVHEDMSSSTIHSKADALQVSCTQLDQKTDALHIKLDGLAARMCEGIPTTRQPHVPLPDAVPSAGGGQHELALHQEVVHGRFDGIGALIEELHHKLDDLRGGLHYGSSTKAHGLHHVLGNIQVPPLTPRGRSPRAAAAAAAAGPEAVGVQISTPRVESAAELDPDLPPEKNFLLRHKFLSRVKMESAIETNLLKIANFFCLLLAFMSCLGMYDPSVQISKIHANLHLSFDTEVALAATDTSDILNYLDTFLEKAYTMAPALVDANTMNSIDFARCTDSDVGDVCRLTYWMSIGMTPADKENINRIIMDQVTESNARSILDCDAGNAPDNCVDRNGQLVAENSADKTLGLLPEDPIILQSRLDYPRASVVPLTPVVWQTRAPRKECSGFGDKYNYEVLGAGLCGVEDDCDPEAVTSFAGTKPAVRTNRAQSFFISYSEAPFSCVDRALYETTFMDRSWHPWATREDLTAGIEMQAENLAGLPVFYKFVSDVAYLQRPINGSVLADSSGNCFNPCTEASDLCTDPILYGDHALWKEDGDNNIYLPQNDTCTLRKGWSDRYLQKSIGDRMNTFLTLETTSFTVSVMVVTPQPEEYPDVQTLVRVKWEIDQGGTVTGSASIQSTSQTTDTWFYLVGMTVLLSLCHMGAAFYDIYKTFVSIEDTQAVKRKRRQAAIIDIVIALATCAVVLTNMVLELLPPDVSAELLQSFKANNQDTYFSVFRDIVVYNENIAMLKQFGFLNVCLLFGRLVLFFSIHPRLAVLVSCANHMADTLFHFSVYFFMIFSVLAFLGHWMFSSENNLRFGSLGVAVYTQFKMFVGEIPWPDGIPDMYFYIYLVLYVFMVVVFLMNFLLAIMVSAFFAVEQQTGRCDTERNVLSDFYDVGKCVIKRVRNGYPSAWRVFQYLDDQLESPTKPPLHLGSKELYEGLKHPETDKPLFKNEDHAQQFIEYYLTKVKGTDGTSVLKYPTY
eukprot:TRINITY_DN3891_c0_g5_i1.p1 TRINITY_DN3891_c0_g5~~TRINITY_DN3891_c0_g5_i1.p1  ORF type:complete len:1180 (+),score=202.44 TRINITY_DN3891_c0_g5_i1:86-3625(+)